MRYYTFFIVFGLGVRYAQCFWPPAYKIDLNDRKVFVIESDETDYDDESEDEMIRAADLAEFESLATDDEKYKPLHSHVKHYNKRAARTATEFADVFPNMFEPNLEVIHNLVEEAKPFVAGLKHELDEYDFDDLEERILKAVRKKRSASNDFTTNRGLTLTTKPPSSINANFTEVTKSRVQGEVILNHEATNPTTEVMEKLIFTTLGDRTSQTEESQMRETHEITPQENVESEDKFNNDKTMTEILGEEGYDYQQSKAEYYDQIEYSKSDNKTFNYTNNGDPEETAGDAIKEIMDFNMPRNCTREELTQFGIKALECLAYDYKNAKNERNVRKILSRTWLVIRIWLCIYLFIAIPCWCQKGWCCCCFNCAFCMPEETIHRAKKYYAQNPPGVLTEDDGKNESKFTEFEPTLLELDAYEKFESAIRNL